MWVSKCDSELFQVLEEMEREFGISYPSGLPPEERQQYQRDVLALHQRNCALRDTLHTRQDELEGVKGTVGEMEEERNRLQERVGGSQWSKSVPSLWRVGKRFTVHDLNSFV